MSNMRWAFRLEAAAELICERFSDDNGEPQYWRDFASTPGQIKETIERAIAEKADEIWLTYRDSGKLRYFYIVPTDDGYKKEEAVHVPLWIQAQGKFYAEHLEEVRRQTA